MLSSTRKTARPAGYLAKRAFLLPYAEEKASVDPDSNLIARSVAAQAITAPAIPGRDQTLSHAEWANSNTQADQPSELPHARISQLALRRIAANRCGISAHLLT